MNNKYNLENEDLNEIYHWTDSINLSRAKKNISRDFSDCLLAAEIIKNYFPKLVDLHNYPPTHNVKQKFNNWNLLKEKVLKKLKLKVNDLLLEDLANSKPKAIEYFLFLLKSKLENYKEEKNFSNSRNNTIIQNSNNNTYISKNENSYIPKFDNSNYYNNKAPNQEVYNQNYFNSIPNEYKNKSIKDYEIMIIERDNIIQSLRETLEIVELKNKKLEELIQIKDNKINSLTNNF